MCLGEAEDRHDGIADELFERAAIGGDDAARVLVVTTHQSAHVFGVQSITQSGRAGDVSEEDADQFTLFGHQFPPFSVMLQAVCSREAWPEALAFCW